MIRIRRLARLVVLGLLLASAAPAQEVGRVAGVEGVAEIGRAGTWTAARIGAAVELRDELRTGEPGRLRVVFQDDSVLNLGDASQLIVDEQVFDPDRGAVRSLVRLLRGKVNALVSEYYQQPGNAYEVETVTAVAGVRGTEFVVRYDPRTETTEVIGVSGRVEVHSVLDRVRRGVFITAREATRVPLGQFPSAPYPVEEMLFRQHLEGLDFIGTGRAESLTASRPVVGADTVPAADRAPRAGAAPVPGEGLRAGDASSLVDQPFRVLEGERGRLRVRY